MADPLIIDIPESYQTYRAKTARQEIVDTIDIISKDAAPSAIPLDHDTIICHPDDSHKFRQFVLQFKIIKCKELEPGKAYTMRGASLTDWMPKPDLGLIDSMLGAKVPPYYSPTLKIPSPMPYLVRNIPMWPAFVPESLEQTEARDYCEHAMRYFRGFAKWRRARKYMDPLLDPTYVHPKRKRHV